MAQRDSVRIVEAFWREVWQRQNPDAVDHWVHVDVVLTSGGCDLGPRAEFKELIRQFLARVVDFRFQVIETFQSEDGTRVASRWKVTGRNNGLMGTKPNGAPFEMTGTAVWDVGEDGLLRHNWVERNAFEV